MKTGGKLVTKDQFSAGGVAFREISGNIEIAIILTEPEHRWQLPKGMIDRGETPEEAALREVREEAGIDTDIIDTIDRIRERVPLLRAAISRAIDLDVVIDRSASIRASVHDVEMALVISIALVILVVFLFLRDVRATAIPSVVVPLSLIGTFGAMYLLDYSIDNLSLMALTISTGFVGVPGAVVWKTRRPVR